MSNESPFSASFPAEVLYDDSSPAIWLTSEEAADLLPDKPLIHIYRLVGEEIFIGGLCFKRDIVTLFKQNRRLTIAYSEARKINHGIYYYYDRDIYIETDAKKLDDFIKNHYDESTD